MARFCTWRAVFLVGGLLAALYALASLEFRPDTAAAGPAFQSGTSTPIIVDNGFNTFGADLVMGVAATPGAAGTPGVYEPVRTDGSGRLQTSSSSGSGGAYAPGTVVPIQPNGAVAAQTPVSVAITNIPTAAPSLTPYSVGSAAVQPMQPNGAQAAQTPFAVFTPIVRVVGTLPPSDLTTPLPISGAAVAVSLTTPVPAGENVIGKVGGNTLHPSQNPTLTVAASYVTGDYIGTSATAWQWTGCRTATGTGQLQSVTVVDKALQSIAGEVWLFDRSVTVPNDSAAWTITDADAQFLLGVVPTGPYYASAANSVSVATGVGLTVWCNAGSLIYGAFVTRGSPSYASGDLTIILGLSVD